MLSSLKKITHKKKRRIGRGYGSNKGGHTVGRGSKGAKARYKIALTYDGTKIKKGWIKRMPLWRGKNKLKNRKMAVAVNLSSLEKWYEDGQKVTFKDLSQKLNLPKTKTGNLSLKILSKGKLTKKLEVLLPCSEKAVQKITSLGGKVLAPALQPAKMKK